MKLGILGGSFNPVHIAHLFIAEEAQARFALDTVCLMPAFIPPHKMNDQILTPQKRLALLHAAVDGTALTISDFEIAKQGISYTIDTVRHFAENYDVHLIIGGDSALQFTTWRDYNQIFDYAKVIVFPRNNGTVNDVRSVWGDHFLYCDMPLLDVSSSDIRARILEGKPYRWLVPGPVFTLIESERLYRND